MVYIIDDVFCIVKEYMFGIPFKGIIEIIGEAYLNIHKHDRPQCTYTLTTSGHLNSKGRLTGRCLSYWQSGNVMYISNYINGMLHGNRKTYCDGHNLYNNGLILECNYLNGKYTKRYIKWYPGGHVYTDYMVRHACKGKTKKGKKCSRTGIYDDLTRCIYHRQIQFK